jgi:cbb3-type cytochrome oxidase subunit 1
MSNVGRNYILIALVWLLVGMSVGLWVGATNALEYRSLHITIMMLGFVLLGIYGAIYRLWPQLQTARLAPLQFWLSTVGVLLMNIGTLIQAQGGSILVDGTGAALVFSGAIGLIFLFLTNALNDVGGNEKLIQPTARATL